MGPMILISVLTWNCEVLHKGYISSTVL